MSRLSPNPVSLSSLGVRSSSAGEHRDVHCPRVNACVDTAVRGNWEGFSCARCPLKGVVKGPKVEEYLVRGEGMESRLPSSR